MSDINPQPDAAGSRVRNPAQLALLQSLLESTQRPANTMNLYQLDGYLRALACAPVKPPPSEWQPLIFNDEDPQFSDLDQAAMVQDAIADLFQFHCDQVIADICDLPCVAHYTEVRAERTNIEQWARGFLQGYIVCENSWGALLDAMQCDPKSPGSGCGGDYGIECNKNIDDFDAILSTVSVVADAEYAVQGEINKKDLGAIFTQLPEAMVRWGQIGRWFGK